MKRKPILIAIVLLLLTLVILRETGILGINFYRSELKTKHTALQTVEQQGDTRPISYHLTVKYRNKTFFESTHTSDNPSPVEVEAMLEEPTYTGNTWLPFSKNFEMVYLCTFTATKAPAELKAEGKIEGKVTATIRGLCSRAQARDLTLQEAKNYIQSYFQKEFNP